MAENVQITENDVRLMIAETMHEHEQACAERYTEIAGKFGKLENGQLWARILLLMILGAIVVTALKDLF